MAKKKKQTVKEALEEIQKAAEKGDDNVLVKYAQDEREVVREAANNALDVLDKDAIDEVNKAPEKAKAIVEDVKEEKKEVDRKGWIKMTPEEAKKYELQEKLIGYNPHEGIGLIK